MLTQLCLNIVIWNLDYQLSYETFGLNGPELLEPKQLLHIDSIVLKYGKQGEEKGFKRGSVRP